MADRMITCPECWGDSVIYDHPECDLCWNKGGIPDRRKPTASDRAVERIREWCAIIPEPGRPPELCAAESYVCSAIMGIINEEAANG